MSFLRSPAVAVWLVVGAGTCGISAAWAGNGQTGKLHPWVLVAMFWGAALLSVLIHYVSRYLARAAGWTRRAWHRQAPARAGLARRARLALAQASVRSLASAGQGWETARRAWEQQIAGARRAPGAVLGWSRSALRALRV